MFHIFIPANWESDNFYKTINPLLLISSKVIMVILIPLISHASRGQNDCSGHKYPLMKFWKKYTNHY